MKRLLITDVSSPLSNEKEKRITALMDDHRLIEATAEAVPEEQKNDFPVRAGGIYIGRVQRVLPNLNAAFVEIQPGLACFLPADATRHPVYTKKIHPLRMVQNEELLVQVSRGAKGRKAPSVSTNINLTGRYLVLTSGSRRLGLSSKLKKGERDHLRKLLAPLLPDDIGIIVRTNARYATDDEIFSELSILEKQWHYIRSYAASKKCFSCIQPAEESYIKAFRDLNLTLYEEAVTDLPEVYEKLQMYSAQYNDLRGFPVRLYRDCDFPLAAAAGLNPALEKAVKKKAWLKSGGFLVIEPTEALTSIDVNSGKNTENAGKHRNFYLQTNLEAATEIAVQIRLRNMSGIILVDFINMDSEDDYRILLRHFKKCLQRDRIPVQLIDRTKLGLVELTRKKTGPTLAEQLEK